MMKLKMMKKLEKILLWRGTPVENVGKVGEKTYSIYVL